MLNAALDFSCSELSFAAVQPDGRTLASFQVDLPGRDSSSLPILVGKALKEAVRLLRQTGTPVLGCILNKTAANRMGKTGYYYGGKYGYRKPETKKVSKPARIRKGN